jgi:hypothetical protein
MPISLNELRSAAGRSHRTRLYASLSEALTNSKGTAFLCHSHKDKELVQGLQVLLAENGLDLYVDWQDHHMPDTPNKQTAENIKQRIIAYDWFLFLATPNSTDSRWCPWEIGYADSKKSHDKIFVIPTTDSSGSWYGNEYLQLYRQITFASDRSLAAFPAGQASNGIHVRYLR